MTTCIVIPVHNEVDNIAGLVSQSKHYGKVVVVDDSSRDSTAAEAAKIGATVLVNGIGWKREAQYGDGFRRGVGFALDVGAAETIVLMDAGGSHVPKDIPRLIQALSSRDVAIGSRVLPTSCYSQRAHRWLLTQLATRLLGALTEGKVRDYSSFRAFTRKGAERALILSEGLDPRAHIFNPLLAYRMARAGMEMVEVPITYHGTTSTLKPWTTVVAALSLAREVARERRKPTC